LDGRSSDERFIVSKPVHWSLIFVVLAMLSVTGCNTVRGVGQDVEAAGGALAGTAQKTEDKLSK
jgi:predicted small secreted protein